MNQTVEKFVETVQQVHTETSLSASGVSGSFVGHGP